MLNENRLENEKKNKSFEFTELYQYVLDLMLIIIQIIIINIHRL